MLTVTPLTRPMLEHYWPAVRNYLVTAATRSDSVCLPERVFSSMYSETAFVYLLHWERKLVGTLVVRTTTSDAEDTDLDVWALATDPGMPGELFNQLNDHLEKHAQSVQARTISMASTRKGWGRFLERLGWKPTFITYERPVPPTKDSDNG